MRRAYLKPSRLSVTELFCKNSEGWKSLTIFAKTIHHRLLIWFINMCHSNTVKKLDIKKTRLKKEIKDLSFKVTDPSTHIFKKYFL